jgi:hypothetical protein
MNNAYPYRRPPLLLLPELLLVELPEDEDRVELLVPEDL